MSLHYATTCHRNTIISVAELVGAFDRPNQFIALWKSSRRHGRHTRSRHDKLLMLRLLLLCKFDDIKKGARRQISVIADWFYAGKANYVRQTYQAKHRRPKLETISSIDW